MTKRQATAIIKRMSPRQRVTLKEYLPLMLMKNQILGLKVDKELLKHVDRKLQEVPA